MVEDIFLYIGAFISAKLFLALGRIYVPLDRNLELFDRFNRSEDFDDPGNCGKNVSNALRLVDLSAMLMPTLLSSEEQSYTAKEKRKKLLSTMLPALLLPK